MAKTSDPRHALQAPPAEKKQLVASMFDRIAGPYDTLNWVLSMGQTSRWRRQALAQVTLAAGDRILDVGCGTGWVSRFLRRFHDIPLKIEGLDVSEEMLRLARQKDPQTDYFEAQVEAIPRPAAHFDLVLSVYTTRNFADLEQGLAEMVRVLRPDGQLLVLDAFPSPHRFWRAVLGLWMGRVVPFLVSPFTDAQAYRYLWQSIQRHRSPQELGGILDTLGCQNIDILPLGWGAAACITARKQLA